jgi:hypothetical protein
MKRFKHVLAYTAAALTIAAAVLSPFLLFGWFTGAVAALHLHVDETYSGGQPAFTIERPGYRILVNRPVVPRAPVPSVPAFLQIAWTPADKLPALVADDVDIDGDGTPDLRARFAVPRDPDAPLQVDVVPLSPRVVAMHRVATASFAALIARVGDRIVVRVPLDLAR